MIDENRLLDDLEELAERLGIKIRHDAIHLEDESIHVAGGLCQLRGEFLIIINSRSPIEERIRTLAEALKHFDLDQMYIRPAVREVLNKVSCPSIGVDRGEENRP
jgi:hypothetical protein